MHKHSYPLQKIKTENFNFPTNKSLDTWNINKSGYHILVRHWLILLYKSTLCILFRSKSAEHFVGFVACFISHKSSQYKHNLGHSITLLTFHQLVHAGDLCCPINRIYGPHPLWQVDIVWQRSCEVSQECFYGPKSLLRNGKNNPFEVAVPIAIETNLLGLLFWGQCLQCPGSVQAAVSTMSGTGESISSWAPSGISLGLVPLIKMLQLHVCAVLSDHKKIQGKCLLFEYVISFK